MHFPDLVSLSLSGTPGVRDAAVLSTLRDLRNLRVLKLAGVGLKDADFAIVAYCIGARVLSLDISRNNLTDASVDWLLNYCIKPCTPPGDDNRAPENEIFEIVDLDGHVRSKLTQAFIGSLAVEEAHGDGITHLNISDNLVTVDGVARLLKSRQLHVIDAGVISREAAQGHNRGATSKTFDIHGIQDLTTMIASFAARRLLYLRINHAVITKETTSYERYGDTPQQPSQCGPYTREPPYGILGPPKPAPRGCLYPASLRKLQVLVLTGIPSHTREASILTSLIECIKSCASLCFLDNQLAKYAYTLPPGRNRPLAEREYVYKASGLRRIVLEIVPAKVDLVQRNAEGIERGGGESSAPGLGSGWRHQGSSSLSMTEDPDSDVLWKAASQDFSFFDGDGNGEEECGVPRAEENRRTPVSNLSAEMEGLMLADEEGEVRSGARPGAAPILDVVSEIARFRRERREAYDAAIQRGEVDFEVDGYWPGDVTVVRMPSNGEGGGPDYYGDRYESGWLYR